MGELIEKFKDLSLAAKGAIAVATFVFLGFVYYEYFYSTKSEELAELETKIETLNQSITQKRRLAKDLDKFRREVKDLEVKLKFALRELPDEREIPDLLSSISNLARDAGLEVSLFKPGNPSKKEFYEEVPVSISVEGSFHQVATFFDEVAHLNRIVNINQVFLREPKNTPDRLTVKTDCIATTFRYLEEGERLKQTDEAQGKRRRG